MKLRRIDMQNYVDDETGTYFYLPLHDVDNFEQAEAMIQMDIDCYLGQYPAEDYWGTRRTVLPIVHLDPPPTI